MSGASAIGSGGLGGAVVRTLVFAAIVFLLCWVISVLLFGVINGRFSLRSAFASVSFAAWFVLLPALVWGAVLNIMAVRDHRFSRAQHAGLAAGVALCCIPLTFGLLMILPPLIRAGGNGRFDEFGFLTGLVFMGSAVLVVIFPVLVLPLMRFSRALKLDGLFARPEVVASRGEGA